VQCDFNPLFSHLILQVQLSVYLYITERNISRSASAKKPRHTAGMDCKTDQTIQMDTQCTWSTLSLGDRGWTSRL